MNDDDVLAALDLNADALTFDYCLLCDADIDAEHADEEGHPGLCCQCHAREGGRC
jgi:hypothetical protein